MEPCCRPLSDEFLSPRIDGKRVSSTRGNMGTNIMSRSGFIRAFFRACEFGAALLCAALLSCPVAVSAKIPRGVFSIANVDKDPPNTVLENPDVEGISLRHAWSTLEPTEGNFDFTFLDEAVDLCTTNGKQALIRI